MCEGVLKAKAFILMTMSSFISVETNYLANEFSCVRNLDLHFRFSMCVSLQENSESVNASELDFL